MSLDLATFAETVSDNFEGFESGDADWVQYVNLVPYTHAHLNNTVLNGQKILARDILSLDNGTVVYRAHGVQTLKVKIFHSSGTFATRKRDDQNPEEGKYILGSETDQCRDPFKVYYCKKDDKLYLNHLNKEWRECYYDPVSHYQFKKSDAEFNAENFGQELVFYGVNVYTSNDNFEFKIVPDCTIEAAERVELFYGGNDNRQISHYMEVLSFSIPENVTTIKVVISNFERYYLDDGTKHELKPENKQKSFILLANIELIGDKIDLNYYGDPGEPVNGKTIKVREKTPPKAKGPKPAKAKNLKEKRKGEGEEDEEREVREDGKIQRVSKTTHSDIVAVGLGPAVSEVAADFRPTVTKPITKPVKSEKIKKRREVKKSTPRKKRQLTEKITEKGSVPQNEEKAIFLRSDSNRKKELPKSNKLLSTSYVVSAGSVAAWLIFEDHLKALASKVISHLHKFRH